MDGINWTAGIDPKTGKPVEYDPAQPLQTYNVETNRTDCRAHQAACPANVGGNNFWPSTLSRKTNLHLHPGDHRLRGIHHRHRKSIRSRRALAAAAMSSTNAWKASWLLPIRSRGEIKKRVQLKYPNYAGAMSTAGGLVFTALMDGTLIAFDDETLDEVWRVNVGVGFTAPPMTFAVEDKQYIAIASGLSGSARGKLRMTPELAEQRNAAMLFVFGL